MIGERKTVLALHDVHACCNLLVVFLETPRGRILYDAAGHALNSCGSGASRHVQEAAGRGGRGLLKGTRAKPVPPRA